MRQPRDLGPGAAAMSTTGTPTRRIDEIIIGKRFRRDMGDIAAFGARIKKLVRLVQPIAINPNNELMGGARRLAACKLLGWTHVPVHVVDLDQIIDGEFAENVDRKDFTPSELVAI